MAEAGGDGPEGQAMMNDADDDGAMNEGGAPDAAESKPKEEEDDSDPRTCIKITSWIVLALGIVVGIWGLVYVIIELTNGAEED